MAYHEYDEDGNLIMTHPFQFTFSNREDYLSFLENCRKEKKISLEGVGKIIGVNKPTASKIFRGKLGLSTEKLIKLLDFFDYELIASELIRDEDYAMFMSDGEYQKDLERWDLQDEITEKFKEEDKK